MSFFVKLKAGSEESQLTSSHQLDKLAVMLCKVNIDQYVVPS